ncbi:hypothetical protein EJB05_20049, partial [Eragrostis curvula]
MSSSWRNARSHLPVAPNRLRRLPRRASASPSRLHLPVDAPTRRRRLPARWRLNWPAPPLLSLRRPSVELRPLRAAAGADVDSKDGQRNEAWLEIIKPYKKI